MKEITSFQYFYTLIKFASFAEFNRLPMISTKLEFIASYYSSHSRKRQETIEEFSITIII